MSPQITRRTTSKTLLRSFICNLSGRGQWSLCNIQGIQYSTFNTSFGLLPSLYNSSITPGEAFPGDWVQVPRPPSDAYDHYVYGSAMRSNTFSWFVVDFADTARFESGTDKETKWSLTEIGVEGAWSIVRIKNSRTILFYNIRATWCTEIGAYASHA